MHSAHDRDAYIIINTKNVNDSSKANFFKISNIEVSHFGTTYDYDSVMHYGAFAYSNNGQPTIIPLVCLILFFFLLNIYCFFS